MKETTDFMAPFFGIDVATKPRGKMKYMDWHKAVKLILSHKNSTITAGLREDWGNTSGTIFKNGHFYDGGWHFYGQSNWATPIIDIDGEEIECWTYDSPYGADCPWAGLDGVLQEGDTYAE